MGSVFTYHTAGAPGRNFRILLMSFRQSPTWEAPPAWEASSPTTTYSLATQLAEPTLGTFDFYTAPCGGMLGNFAASVGACDAELEKYDEAKLSQRVADALLLEHAVCLCKRAYSAASPTVQVALGRCRRYFK